MVDIVGSLYGRDVENVSLDGAGTNVGCTFREAVMRALMRVLMAMVPAPCKHAGEAGAEMVVVPMALELVASISALRISIPPDLRPADARRSVLLQLQVGVLLKVGRKVGVLLKDWCGWEGGGASQIGQEVEGH